MSEVITNNWGIVGPVYYRHWVLAQDRRVFVVAAVRLLDAGFYGCIYTNAEASTTRVAAERSDFADLASAQLWCEQTAAPLVVSMCLTN